MRTTLTIDDDVLSAARRLAARQGCGVGEVISGLSRQALGLSSPTERNGLRLLAARPGARPVTPQIVGRLRDAPA